jgi:hypothetical protein
MLDKLLTVFIWSWIGVCALYIVGVAALVLAATYTQGAPWYLWLYLIFWLIPTSIIWTDSFPDLAGRVLLFSPLIGAYFWRLHLRDKAYQTRMANPKNRPARTG